MVENVIQIKSGITINIDGNTKNQLMWEKDYIWIPTTCSYKNGKYLASIIDSSVITFDEIIKENKTTPINFNKKKQPVKYKIFAFLTAFLLTTITLLIVISIYCYLIKCLAKQKQLLPYHIANKKLRGALY